MLVPKGDDFEASYVDQFTGRHAKEILVADLNEDGRPELYAAVEAELTTAGQAQPVEIRRYSPAGKQWRHDTLARLEIAVQCRVLLAADSTGRGKDLIATTMKDGVWRLISRPGYRFQPEQIDPESSGFEHAATTADLDGDGKLELYVAADDQDEIRQYTWDGARFHRAVIGRLPRAQRHHLEYHAVSAIGAG